MLNHSRATIGICYIQTLLVHSNTTIKMYMQIPVNNFKSIRNPLDL